MQNVFQAKEGSAPWKIGDKCGDPYTVPLCALRQCGAVVQSWGGGGADRAEDEGPGRPRGLEFPGQNTREEKTARRKDPVSGVCRGPLEYSAEHPPPHSCRETTRGWRKNGLNPLEVPVLVLTQNWEYCFSQQPGWIKAHNSWGVG